MEFSCYYFSNSLKDFLGKNKPDMALSWQFCLVNIKYRRL